MRKSKFSNTKKLKILAKWDAGSKIDDLCREYQVSSATLYNWKKEKATNEDDTQRELKLLRQQNAQLKKMFANLSMDHEILKEGYEMAKMYVAQDANRHSEHSIRRGCRVLGFRRQTYYSRKKGDRPEERDEELINLLRHTCRLFIAWGFWMIFYYLRNEYDLPDNHKRVYRLWKQAGNIRSFYLLN